MYFIQCFFVVFKHSYGASSMSDELIPIKGIIDSFLMLLQIQWMPVIRTSLGIAYNVLITGMSDTMDIAYKNTLGSRKYVHRTCTHYVCVYENRFFRRWF